MFGKNKIKPTVEVIKDTTSRINEDIVGLNNRKDVAISVFRQTANNLNVINEELNASVSQLNELHEFIVSQTESASKMIADNEAVRGRILDIIGE